jgi:tetratricopeptide (TPR) repeat protein
MSNSANPFIWIVPRRVVLCALLMSLLIGCAARTARETVSPVENQLMAEIALQRGQYLVAVQEYLILAERSADPEHARRATELAYEYEFLVHALSAAERWVELQPQDQLAHAYLGRLYVRRNLPEEAFSSLDLSLGPVADRNDRDYLLLSGELADLAAPRRGLEVFRLFNKTYPGAPAITSSMATLAALSGDTELAVDAGRETLLLAPDWALARVAFARYLLADGQTASAFEQMAYAQEMNPGLAMELEFVRLLAMAGEQEDARARIERLFVRYPAEPDLIRLRGSLALEWGDYKIAAADFSFLLSEAYYVSESFWHLGQIAYAQQKFLQAIRYFKRVSDGPWKPASVNAISRAYLALGDANTALAVQRDYASHYPQRVIQQALMRANILATADRLAEAIETIDSALEFDPWNEELWLYRGGLIEQTGDIDGAVDSFREAHKLAPDDPQILNALGYTLTVAGQNYAEASSLINKALELRPDNPAFMDSMGWILYRQGQQAAARGWLEQAYSLLPDPEIAAHLGEVMWMQGEEGAAQSIWAEALERYPDSPILNETTGRFLQ